MSTDCKQGTSLHGMGLWGFGWRGTHLLIKVYLLEVLVELARETSLAEVIFGVIRQTLLIELSLEILKGQGVVENGNVTSWRRVEVGPWLDGSGERRRRHGREDHKY